MGLIIRSIDLFTTFIMHRITVFGAPGQVGKRIIAQGLALGYQMTAFGRNVENLLDKESRNDHLTAIKGYVFDAGNVLEAIKGADAVLSVLGGSMDGTDRTRSLGMKNIVEQMEIAGIKRIVALGGMGILNAANGDYLLHAAGYPEVYKAVGQEHLLAFEQLKNSKLDWSFVCAPDILYTDQTLQYHTRADYPPEPNLYRIAAGDLADCMLKECFHPAFLHQRIGISAN